MSLPLKNYLSVTKKEWNGLIVLFILIVLVLAAPYAWKKLHPYQLVNPKGFDAAASRLHVADTDTAKYTDTRLFRFDPNNLPNTAWRKLGFSEHQVTIIKNYEAKGGRFYSKGDLKKIYSITDSDYKRIAPYINLPEKSGYQPKTNAVVEINTADTTKLTGIRGIGSGFATRIIRYRDRLGGFYRKEQLKEIYGVDSLMYLDIVPFIKVDVRKISKININHPDKDRLLVFPYLTYKQKNAIVEYHTQHGDYTQLSDLKNIPIIDDVILRKIEPYISFK